MGYIILGAIVFAAIGAMSLLASLIFRRVVPTNMVHIVQSKKVKTSYGSNRSSGNVYYAWPAWFPIIGVSVSILPLNNFTVSLKEYEAFDKNRLPFVVDVQAFFHIDDPDKAAERVQTFDTLVHDLSNVVQGAIRRILATNDLEFIMQDRSSLATEFTKEVEHQLPEWGVNTVKSIEFLDIRDSRESKVIHNIMAKDQSRIERESRVAIADNAKQAQTAEIEAKRQIDLSTQEAEQQVGIRTAQKDKEVGMARETSRQEVLNAEKTTTDRQMEVTRVSEIRTAEIAKERAKIDADAYTIRTTGEAQANLNATKLAAEGIAETGKADAAAETAKLLAPVTAQVTLAEKIGADQGYQQYLITVRNIEAQEAIGKAMAEAIADADLKVIANGGDIGSGVSTLTDMLSSAGGTRLGSMLTALGQSEEGRALLDVGMNLLNKNEVIEGKTAKK